MSVTIDIRFFNNLLGCRYSRWHHDTVAHSVNQFFVGWHNCRQRPAHFHPIVFDKIVRAQADPTFQCSHLAIFTFVILMLEQTALMELLQNRGLLAETRQRMFDSFLPFAVRKIGAECDTAAAPTERRKSAHLQKQKSIFLTELYQLVPIMNFQSRNDGMLRQRRRIEQP